MNLKFQGSTKHSDLKQNLDITLSNYLSIPQQHENCIHFITISNTLRL